MISPVLILFRHGNTFEAGQTPVWVGARTDLPLTAEGEAQAKAAADYVRNAAVSVEAMVAGPLQRTRRFADVIGAVVKQTAIIDDRLREIDYGLWEGLSGDVIKQRYGAAALEAWEKNGQWPEGMNWSPSLEELQKNLRAFLREQRERLQSGKGFRIAVTSNGILRLVYQIVTGNKPGNEAKVKTGHYCVLVPEKDGWRIEGWNKNPDPRSPTPGPYL
ncbi:MAG: histidine phosphatase family protein [Alphaproteobacteria bacterium]|nr:histidine phosphatase family protein [Alphaproteobacteria bacterium]